VLRPTRHITRYIGVKPSQAIDATATDNQATKTRKNTHQTHKTNLNTN